MTKTQWPIDGKLGKDFRITSEFGWRTHPTSGKKSHHNGVDLWSAAATTYNEVFHDGTVIFAGPSKLRKPDGSVGGFGYHTMVRHKIEGKYYISVYAHNTLGSIKLKVGQKVEAGTVAGKMGATGDVTGKHLHFEIYVGKTYKWSATGKNFIDPIKFIKALKAKEAVLATAPIDTPMPAIVADVPTHDEAQALKLEAEYRQAKASKPVEKPQAAPEKTYKVKPGDSYWAIAAAHPAGDRTVEQRVKKLQEINDNKSLHPGDTLKLY